MSIKLNVLDIVSTQLHSSTISYYLHIKSKDYLGYLHNLQFNVLTLSMLLFLLSE